MADRTSDAKQPVTITLESDPNQVLTFDVCRIENHSANAESTDYPIEDSADASDHIRKLADEIGLVADVTDHPLVVNRSTDATAPNTGGDSNQRAVSAFDWLYDAQDRGELVAVFTKLRPYRNMNIQSLNVTRDKDTSRVLAAEIQLKQIFVAVTERVDAPVPAEPTMRRKSRRGKKQKKDASEEQKAKAQKAYRDSVGTTILKKVGVFQ